MFPVLTLTLTFEQAKTLQGMERHPSVEGLRSRSSPEGWRLPSVEGLRSRASPQGGRRPSVEGMRARLVSLGDDGDEANIEVQIVKGQSPRLQQHEQQIELLENELDEMDERFEKQEGRLNLLQVYRNLKAISIRSPPSYAPSAASSSLR